MTPPEFVRGDAPNTPDRNRNANRDAIELQPAEADTKATTKPCVRTNQIRRPYSSERGAQKAGPMANPKTNKLIPRENSSLLAPNSALMGWAPPEYADDVSVMARTDRVTMDMILHFLEAEKFLQGGISWLVGCEGW